MESISEDFYNNVYLLSQAKATSDTFKTLFRPGMFDKQNTPGFIHVSQFLLSIYYDKEFCKKELTPWPVFCKQDETKYRNNAKDVICKVANENTDLEFPSILPTYFVHATGTKFMIIMCKLSTAVLRSYIKKELKDDECIPNIPKPSSMLKKVAETYVDNLAKSATEECLLLLNDAKKHEEEVKEYARQQLEEINTCKLKICEKKQILSNHVEKAPINNLSIRNQLLDYANDRDIIPLWKADIEKDIEYLRDKSKFLQKLETLSTEVNDLFENITNVSNVIDGNVIPQINIDLLAEFLPPELQICAHRLYENNTLVLNNLYIIFNCLLNQYWKHIQEIGFPDLSMLNLQLQGSCEDMKTMSDMLQEEYVKCTDFSSEIKKTDQEKQTINVSRGLASTMGEMLLTSTPPIQINLQCDEGKSEHIKQLKLTPKELPRHALFTKYNFLQNAMQTSVMKNTVPIKRIDFDDMELSNTETPVSRRTMMTPKMPWVSTKKFHKYSRLFSTCRKTNDANLSIMSLPATSKANSTSVMNTIGEELTLDISEKSFLNSTRKPLSPNRDIPNIIISSDETCGTILAHNNIKTNNKIVPPPPPPPANFSPIKMDTEEKSEQDKSLKKDGKKEENRRLSISDLVERYRLIMKNSSQTKDLKDILDDSM